MFQRISVVVQHFNSVLLHNSFVPDDQPKCVISVVDLFCDFFHHLWLCALGFKKYNTQICIAPQGHNFRGAENVQLLHCHNTSRLAHS